MRSVLLLVVGLGLGGGGAVLGCGGETTPNYGPPEGLKGSMLMVPTPSSTSTVPPPPSDSGPPPPSDGGAGGDTSTGCPVSWSNTIFPKLNTTYLCTSSACHGGGINTPLMTGQSATMTYQALTAYTMNGTDGQPHPYIKTGSMDPTQSAIECNLTPGATYCGAIRMPSGQIMAMADFMLIDTWIRTCGAPNN